MHARLAVTCHLHFWQNDRDLLRAAAVTQGWNGYQKKSQHRKLTLEKKILPPLQQGFEPATFQSRVRRSNHWAIPAPCNKVALQCIGRAFNFNNLISLSRSFAAALRPQRPCRLFGTGNTGRPPRLSHSSWALCSISARYDVKGSSPPNFHLTGLQAVVVFTRDWDTNTCSWVGVLDGEEDE